MIDKIGGVLSSNGEYLIKMWTVVVSGGKRQLRKHSHMQFEISLINSGEATYTCGNKNYHISKGDVMVFSSNETHCITNVESCGLSMTNLHFEPRCLWGNSLDSLSDKHITFCFSHSKNFENKISNENASNIRELFLKIYNELKEKKGEYTLVVKSLLNLIICDLIRYYGYSNDSISVNQRHICSIRKAYSYIDNHIFDELTLIKIADIAGLSPNYFCSVFKKVSSITLWDYISSKRIDEAIKLITAENSQNMIDIATKCGFNNTANFNKAFKKITGMTPSEYRCSNDSLILL